MKAHREQLALDQVGLRGLAQANGDISRAHGEIKLLVGRDQGQMDIRISSTNSPRRGVSQCTPIPGVVVTRRSPFGRSRLSVSFARAASSCMNTSCAV